MSKVLIVDDEAKITRLLSERITQENFEVESCASAEEALPLIGKGGVDIVLCDLRLGGMNGLELLQRAKKDFPDIDFVIMTAYASASTAVQAMREGAYEYLIKPFQMDEVVLLLRRIQERRELMTENLALREKFSAAAQRSRIIGNSPAIQGVIDIIKKVAPTDTPVLVQGESGTGKELVAAEIHRSSKRASRAFIIINCAAVPETLIESELFGHEKGAFTGAVQKKPGQFKLADGGTLFLDEIGELPLLLQVKLLRAIENGEFLPLGGSRPVQVDVRIIAASNRDLQAMTDSGTFRGDLFYRLNVFPVHIPPLRERLEDILPIAINFLAERRHPSDHLDKDVIEKLRGYSWPGNVRELKNILERALILAGPNPVTTADITISERAGGEMEESSLESLIGIKSLPEIEKSLIEIALARAEGNKSRAAQILGITRRTLYGRLDRYKLGSDDTRPLDE
ncbi:MAG: sigma-54-dependent Fis family transcriptional regulator [Candidatus Krumholzibacteriota bacterium]|nr:sigma-54-dependent Fis family transcriptional regulator [Candidatus Krumholzibacteriota bacterium]